MPTVRQKGQFYPGQMRAMEAATYPFRNVSLQTGNPPTYGMYAARHGQLIPGQVVSGSMVPPQLRGLGRVSANPLGQHRASTVIWAPGTRGIGNGYAQRLIRSARQQPRSRPITLYGSTLRGALAAANILPVSRL